MVIHSSRSLRCFSECCFSEYCVGLSARACNIIVIVISSFHSFCCAYVTFADLSEFMGPRKRVFGCQSHSTVIILVIPKVTGNRDYMHISAYGIYMWNICTYHVIFCMHLEITRSRTLLVLFQTPMNLLRPTRVCSHGVHVTRWMPQSYPHSTTCTAVRVTKPRLPLPMNPMTRMIMRATKRRRGALCVDVSRCVAVPYAVNARARVFRFAFDKQ